MCAHASPSRPRTHTLAPPPAPVVGAVGSDDFTRVKHTGDAGVARAAVQLNLVRSPAQLLCVGVPRDRLILVSTKLPAAHFTTCCPASEKICAISTYVGRMFSDEFWKVMRRKFLGAELCVNLGGVSALSAVCVVGSA